MTTLRLERPPVPDAVLTTVTAVLLAIGLLMVTSASVTLADRQHGDPFFYLERQLLAVALGLGAGYLMVRVPTALWQRLGFALALAAIVLLVLVLIPGLGQTVNGSTRWLRLGGVVVQVSEPARLMLLMYVADYAVRRNEELRRSLLGFIRPLGPVGLAAVLLLVQPDFGSAVLLLAITGCVLLVAGARLAVLGAGVVVAVTAMGLLAWLSPYRMKRITGFMDPWEDPYGKGFQLTQSLIAIGTGEWAGLGLGGSVQKLFYLPEAHNDFLFAVIAEETGMVGATIVIALLLAIAVRMLMLGRRAELRGHRFGAYVAYGIGCLVGTQTLINVGVNTGLLPTKGLTLPFVSYGSNSLIASGVLIGLVLRVHWELTWPPERTHRVR